MNFELPFALCTLVPEDTRGGRSTDNLEIRTTRLPAGTVTGALWLRQDPVASRQHAAAAQSVTLSNSPVRG